MLDKYGGNDLPRFKYKNKTLKLKVHDYFLNAWGGYGNDLQDYSLFIQMCCSALSIIGLNL